MHTKINTGPALAVALAAVIGFLPAVSYGAAWTREEGELLFVAPTTYTIVTEQFDEDGDRVDRSRFEMIELAPLAELGITDYLTGGVQPKFRWVKLDTATGEESNAGFPEVDAFTRLRLWTDGDAVFSLQGLVKAPIDPQEDEVAALGRNQVDTEFRALFGNRHRFESDVIFYNVELGFRKRFGDPSDQIHGDAFIGWATGPYSVILHSLNTIGLNNDATGAQVLTADPDFRKHAVQLTGAYRITNAVSLAAGASTTYAGTNVGAGYSGFVSALVRF